MYFLERPLKEALAFKGRNLFLKKIKIKVNFFPKGHICPQHSLPTRDIYVPTAVKGLNITINKLIDPSKLVPKCWFNDLT